jgi:hypothetical protein
MDDCNVCGGENACHDCFGFPYGDAVWDNCGACDNDPTNDCVPDCNGDWGGLDNVADSGDEASIDECGVCGGDDTSCADCADVPNGDAVDLGCGCGEPGPSGCDNECGSTAIEDDCGICGGAGTDLDNDGGGSLVDDLCGVCDGDNAPDTGTCDCNSVPDGELEYDCAGVCGGPAEYDCTYDADDQTTWPGACNGTAVEDCAGVCEGEGVDEDQDEICDEDSDDCISTGAAHLYYDIYGEIITQIVINEDGEPTAVSDPWRGGYDECGVCNGDGKIFECGCGYLPQLCACMNEGNGDVDLYDGIDNKEECEDNNDGDWNCENACECDAE